jgi:hypothetical protein
VDPSDVAALLASGGVPAVYLDPGAADAASEDAVDRGAGYNGMLDPRATETLGRMAAEALAPYRPTSVLVWENPPDLILAHVVARELSATVVRAFDADGLLHFSGTFPEGARAVLLADVFRDPLVVEALAALVRRQGGTPVVIAQLFARPGAAGVELPGVPAVVLARGAAS